MNLESLLEAKKSAIAARWFDSVLETYPADTSKFLRKEQNKFSNPVGATIFDSLEKILNELILGGDPEKISPFLDNIIRVRAVQDFSPSQAISFIFSLKAVVREEIGKDQGGALPHPELHEFDKKIDSLALQCFDIFVQCREKLYDIKANELRKMTYRLIQRANKMGDDREEDSDPAEGNIDN